jgi:hypothetical protein
MLRGCFSMIGSAVLVVVLLIAGWFYRDEIERYARGTASRLFNRDEATVELAGATSPELAEQAERKIIALGQGEAHEITLSAEELSGWIEHRLVGYFPEYISDVTTSVESDQLELTGRVATRSVPGLDGLGPAVAFLPDTADVTTSGRLDGLEPGRGVYYIENMHIGSLPFPDAWRDDLMAEIKGGTNGDLPVNAVAFDLPPFVTDIGIRDGVVFLRRSRDD